jgi:hypothetical protein
MAGREEIMRLTIATCLALLLPAPLAAAGPDDGVPLSRDEEFAMAVSAAPDHLKDAVGVYVYGERGYEQARASSNGFNCLVQFGGGEMQMLSPTCWDREGSETIMQRDLMYSRLREAGETPEAIRRAITEAYASGTLMAPRKPGIAYMMSADFTRRNPATGERVCIFPPHLMFYAPYATNADLGINPAHVGTTDGPWILGQGSPIAYVIVMPGGVDHSQCH